MPDESSDCSLRAVARRANVSLVTASRALAGSSRVRATTRQRVEQAAEDLDYRRNPLLAAAASRRWRHHLEQTATPLILLSCHRRNLFIDRELGAAETFAKKIGYQLDSVHITEQDSIPTLLRQFEARGVEGLIIAYWESESRERLIELDAWPYTIVEAGRYSDEPRFHATYIDPFAGIQLAAAKAKEAGYQRPGYLLYEHTPKLPDDTLRHAGAVESYRAHAFPESLPPCVIHSFEEVDGAGCRAWLKRWRPDILIAFNVAVEKRFCELPLKAAHIPTVNLHARISKDIVGVTHSLSLAMVAAVEYVHDLRKQGQRGKPDRPFRRVLEAGWQGDLPPKAK